ncbi:MAG: SDR family NAD(P)-dependent oxidoreductase [Aestuariivirgaceae bacterium]|jgi:glucose 1-dehydrogenase
MTSLEGRVALITGGGNGIGRACAERFARDGAKVAVADINGAEGQAVAHGLRDAGHEAVFLQCDVAKSAEVRATVERTVEAFGAVDILVNNAATIKGIDFLEISEEDFDAVLNVNLRGAFLMAQAVARQIVAQVKAGRKPGSVINMSSVNAVFAIANQVPYSVSKGGLNQLTKVMALSLAEYGIRVNAIGPGSINTRILKAVMIDEAARGRILSRTPLGRIGEPEEIASIAAFLASDDASYITGQTIYADGGRMPLNYTVPVKG